MALSALLGGASCAESEPKVVYEPTAESLAQHTAEAEWLKDAKLGIYFHWGPYVVPAYKTEWYPRNMYMPGELKEHHNATYGEDFEYHDFIPLFTAEKFDPKDWAELFEAAGARFAGPVAEHHDGFSMWDSDITPWNAKDMGPKRDVLGELFAELKKRNLKTIATFHHARNLQRYKETWEKEMERIDMGWRFFESSHYPYQLSEQEMMNDPKYKLLYGTMEAEEWYDKVWLGKLEEVIDKYSPDIIWFDSWLDLIPESYRFEFAAYYLNEAQKKNQEVVIVRKQEDLPLDFSILDHEKSREPKAQPRLWMTDDTYSMGSWCYTEDLVIKPTDKVVHSLVDAVSKNGVLLLNISPMADGSIPENQRKGLLELGGWLKKNGQSVYATRPWTVAAEGPTVEPEGGFAEREAFRNLPYSYKDVRYTASKDGGTVYATLLGMPAAGDRVELESFDGIDIKTIKALSGDRINWTWEGDKVVIDFLQPTGEYAYVMAIELE